MSKTFKWGIIGLGKIAHKFAQDLQRIPNATLHAVASRAEEKAKSFAMQYNVPNFFGTYKEIFTCADLDVLYIATPHAMHCENVLMCLEHQVPVLCEKPLAVNATEVKRMITLAKFQKTFLMEAMWTRFLPTTLKVLELIEKGKIGDVQSLRADFGFNANFDPKSRLFNQSLGGGSLLDVGIYPVFLSLLILGKPSSVKASATIGRSNVDENCGMLLKYDNNRMAILQSSIVTNTGTEAYIFGDKGTIRINSRWHEPTSLTLMEQGKEPKDIFFDFDSHGYRYEAEEVMECLRNEKKESSMMSLDFSLDLIELLDTIRMKAGIYYPKNDNFTEAISAAESINFSMN